MKKEFFFAGLIGLTVSGMPMTAQEVDSIQVYHLNEVVVSAIQARK